MTPQCHALRPDGSLCTEPAHYAIPHGWDVRLSCVRHGRRALDGKAPTWSDLPLPAASAMCPDLLVRVAEAEQGILQQIGIVSDHLRDSQSRIAAQHARTLRALEETGVEELVG